MPELPEVETIRKQLESKIIGKKISKIDILFKKQFKDDPKQVINAAIVCLFRSGKILSIKLNNGLYLNFHLKLSGQILYADDINNAEYPEPIPLTGGSKRLPANSTRVIIYFSDNSGLFFNESRKFGWIKITKNQEKQKGIDILSSDFTPDYFISKLNSVRPVKIILMDQDRFAGIGNIYANEILFDAKINPLISSNNLTTQQCSNLYNSILKIINLGIKYCGSSGKDDNYLRPDGTKGGFQQYFKVYQRNGLPCLKCKSIIKRIKQGGRGTFYCPECQK